MVNHRDKRVKHTFTAWETNLVGKNNMNTIFSIGLSKHDQHVAVFSYKVG